MYALHKYVEKLGISKSNLTYKKNKDKENLRYI